MLIRFGCSNYRSIYEYQELLLTASALKDIQADLLYSDGFDKEIIPGAAIYGANASGKTNFLLAIRFMIRFIHHSHQSGLSDGISRHKHKLKGELDSDPSDFDIDFVLDGQHFHYGFSIDDYVVNEEWLYLYSYENRKSRKVLFHRNKAEKTEFYYGKSLKGPNKSVEEIVRPNSLFLSAAVVNNHKMLTKIYDYFHKNFRFRFSQDIGEVSIADNLKRSENVEQIVNFLGKLDTGVKKVEVCEREVPKEQIKLLTGLNKLVKDVMPAAESMDNVFEVPKAVNGLEIFHEGSDGEMVKFSLDDESLGTRSVLALLIPIFDVLNNGGVLVVDELESSLHPLLTLKVAELFSRKSTNPNQAQLIFSTHETNILCSGLLRRDQIWLCEKSLTGDTILTPLTDFRLRKSFDIQNGYLQGRFGAIPFFGDVSQLFETAN